MSDQVAGRTRTRRAEWAKRVQRWQDSGLTAEQFGAEIGVNGRTLTYWKWLLRKEAQGEPGTPAPRAPKPPKTVSVGAAFVEVRTSAADSRFALELRDGRRLLVPSEFDADGLRRLLAVLEGA
jgi:transposase